MASLESALQKALSVRLNLQISLSQLPGIEEWMDIHLDRWLEHIPTPPDMPDMSTVSYGAMLGSDLGRVGRSARLRAEDGGLLQAVQHRQERRARARRRRRDARARARRQLDRRV